MPKITPRSNDTTVIVKTKSREAAQDQPGMWWKADSKQERCNQLLSTAILLKEQQQFRIRQAGIYARMYGNMPLFGWAGTTFNRLAQHSQLPIDRPTMSVVTSCVDTLVSKLTQSKPRPIFLTDNSDYKQRNMAKQLNSFISGELYQTRAYQMGELVLRDALVLGTGCVKILEDQKKRVGLERRLCTEIAVDPNDSMYGDPRQLYEFKLVDRDVAHDMFGSSVVNKAEQAFFDQANDSTKTVSDQIMIVEGWHLPSGPDATDGRRSIACTAGLLDDLSYEKEKVPFEFLHFSPRLLGFWGQGLPEQLMGTQMEINKLLVTMSTSINLMGVPRVWLEDGSKIVKAHINNNVGMVGTYRGTLPTFMEGTTGLGADMYAHLERLVQYAYQQSGISALSANSQKPAGLNSGEAIREYNDLQTDRFAALAKRYDNFYVDIAYQITDLAKDICERDGKYQTIYPNKDGTKQIDLPKAEMLKDPFVIQCYDVSSLPKEPAGRLQKVTEMMQAGIISPQEGRRLLDYTDIEQVDKLANASEERILKILDDIVEEGKFTPPDPFMNLDLANQLVTQYYNLYAAANLDEDKAQMLRDFYSQVGALKSQAASAMAPPPGAMPQGQPQASPEPAPTNPMIPNVPSVPGAA